MKTIENFIKEAIFIHDDKYDYSLSKYLGSKLKISIICKEHGVFKQTPDSHLRGSGCPKCKNKKLSYTTKQFIEKAKQVHGDTYNYSLVEYKNNKTKVKIICPEHDIFEQRPVKHLSNKRGCPKCGIERIKNFQKENPTAWSYSNWKKAGEKSKNFDSFKVYIIRCWNENEEFYKIGKTFTKINNRFKCKKEMPYDYEIIKIFEGDAEEMSRLEKKLQKENKEYKYVPKIKFLGAQECFIQVNYEK